ncbi:MAG: chemotaxis protein [Oceanospirillaceae bacterium]|nr:chemotaxis protein [Oceanospirillaceae bacterium]MBT13790.1 chemotaxis protein [Oceanospirillaceae bacterium]|tara:strand:- start:26984 stop:28900 length:1917 start_codon:yes stop_codon:yes gene_type:complete
MKISLQTKLTGAALFVALVLTIILTGMSIVQMKDSANDSLNSEITGQAKVFSRYLSAWAEDRVNAMEAMADAFSRRIEDEGELNHYDALEILNQAKASAGYNLDFVGLEDGTMYRHDPALDEAKPDYDPRVRAWYKAAKEAKQPIITKPDIAVTGNQLAIYFVAPVMVDGRFYGAVGGLYYLQGIIDDVLSLKVLGDGYAMLVDRDGIISVHPDKNRILKTADVLSPELTPSFLQRAIRNTTPQNLSVSSQDTQVYFHAVENTDWIFMLVMNNKVLNKPINDLTVSMIASAVLLLLSGGVGLYFLIRWALADMKTVSSALEKIAAGGGDLTMRITTKSRDEIGELARNFNQFVEFMHGIVGRLTGIGDELVTEAGNTQALSARSAERIDKQQSEIEMVATAVNEMTQATQEIAGNAANAANTSEEAVALSVQGQQQVRKSQESITRLSSEVGKTSTQIEALNEHVQEITGIVSTISGIAEQTNLLALNAAIEAARAGEQGRGFAVVADEVRELSQRTHASTEEIHRMMTILQEATQAAVKSMADSRVLTETSVEDAEQASVRLDEIRNAVRTISDMAGQIATAAEEQTSVNMEINNNSIAISEAATEMAAIGSQSAQQAGELMTISEKMKEDLSRFII